MKDATKRNRAAEKRATIRAEVEAFARDNPAVTAGEIARRIAAYAPRSSVHRWIAAAVPGRSTRSIGEGALTCLAGLLDIAAAHAHGGRYKLALTCANAAKHVWAAERGDTRARAAINAARNAHAAWRRTVTDQTVGRSW